MDITGLVELIKKDGKKGADAGLVACHEMIARMSAKFAELKEPLPAKLKKTLKKSGANKLFSHQVEAIETVRQGKNAVVMTPAASGKSFTYNLPVLEEVLNDPEARALYLFPLKSLIHDQYKKLDELGSELEIDNLAAIYDGDTPDSERREIRNNPPNIILTNPDMLHLSFLPYHNKWEGFFSELKFVVIDEIHSYRGVFGSHMAHLLRRLRRVAAHYGNKPQFIACSATISNPKELASELTGLNFKSITRSGAPEGLRNFIMIDPTESPYAVATRIFIQSLKAGFKVIAFTKARKITELMAKWTREGAPEMSDIISAYRAGFLPEERRDIEARLFSGELKGVISTSALELGVDIGGLDVCILVGYPGTISSTWQRAGRVGRAGKEALIVMVAIPDALDKYFMNNPEDFFARSAEAATIDLENKIIKKAHLACALSEMKLGAKDPIYDLKKTEPLLKELEREGQVRFLKNEKCWYSKRRHPEREVSIRASGESYRITDEEGKTIGISGSSRVLKELHPGAVYLHSGSQYRVRALDMRRKRVILREEAHPFYTTADSEEDVEILSIDETKDIDGLTITRGTVSVTEKVLGFWEKDIYTRETLKHSTLDLPEETFTTSAVWMEVEEDIIEEVKRKRFGIGGSLHALEHAQIAALPLFALCDRNDLGGVSYSFYPELENPAIFIYDGHEGGVGLTHRGFDVAREWLAATLRLIDECECEKSCPSCTQDPMCGNANDPLDKRGSRVILNRWLRMDEGIPPEKKQGRRKN